MLATKNYLWNAGIFLFKAKDFIGLFKQHAIDIYQLTNSAFKNAITDLGFLKLDQEPWNKLTANSIDYAIMEKSENVVVVPLISKWSDLGDWDSMG